MRVTFGDSGPTAADGLRRSPHFRKTCRASAARSFFLSARLIWLRFTVTCAEQARLVSPPTKCTCRIRASWNAFLGDSKRKAWVPTSSVLGTWQTDRKGFPAGGVSTTAWRIANSVTTIANIHKLINTTGWHFFKFSTFGGQSRGRAPRAGRFWMSCKRGIAVTPFASALSLSNGLKIVRTRQSGGGGRHALICSLARVGLFPGKRFVSRGPGNTAARRRRLQVAGPTWSIAFRVVAAILPAPTAPGQRSSNGGPPRGGLRSGRGSSFRKTSVSVLQEWEEDPAQPSPRR